jgi:PAS domain S-box-containing protein
MKLSYEGKSRGLNHYTMLKEDGTEFLAEAISTGIKDKNGEIKELIGVAQDITDREYAAQELKESEEKFRTIAEQSFMGVLIIQDDKVEYVNKALLDTFNYTEKDIDHWSKEDLINLINPNDLQFLRDYRNKLRQGEPNVKPYYSYQVFTKSGKKKWIDQFSKEINYKGKPAELVTIMDITEKKEAEQEMVKLNSLKSELMRRTSHELKTPLVSIKGYADLLLSVHKENLDDYVLSSVVEIKQGCERLESLIQDILNTAELESGTVQIKKVEDDLAFFIKLSIRELRGLARLRNQTVISNIKNKLITSFEPEQIHQVVSNLINNAIKYTPPDGTIDIDSEIIDGFIKVSVKDSGIGITEEEKERLFTQFGKIERYGQGLDIISEGSGLGLYISKKVIELHGGKLWVESQGRNMGSIFSFTLPIIQEPVQ